MSYSNHLRSRFFPQLLRWGLVVLLGVVAYMVSVTQVSAQPAPHCVEGQTPQFLLGFAHLHSRLGETMGDPVECLYYDQQGNAHQKTTTGKAFYEAKTGTLMFSTETQTWTLTASGLRQVNGNSGEQPAPGPQVGAISWTSRVDNPRQYLPLESRYARVVSEVPVYASVNAIRAGNPFTYHGGGITWVSAHQTTQVNGRTYYWVNWDWGTRGWISANALSFKPMLSELRGVDLRQFQGQQLAMVYYPALNVRSQPGVLTSETLVGTLHAWDVISIKEERAVNGATWYRIGENRWVHGGFVRRFSPSPRPDGIGPNERWVEVNLNNQTVIAHQGDTPIFATLTATGRQDYSTPPGLYRIWVKFRNAPMRWADADPPYNYADVPWIMYFNRGYGLHGAFWHDNYGTIQSAGCVNLSPHDAQWIFNWTGPVVPQGERMARSSAQNPGTWVWTHY